MRLMKGIIILSIKECKSSYQRIWLDIISELELKLIIMFMKSFKSLHSFEFFRVLGGWKDQGP
jgi:hypothetical protein